MTSCFYKPTSYLCIEIKIKYCDMNGNSQSLRTESNKNQSKHTTCISEKWSF